MDRLTLLLGREAMDQALTGRAFVRVVLGMVDKVALAEEPLLQTP